ncbi:hypothetical protein BFO_1854 [Tannerella forsythia 92A2]|uniref:Uncharacterized protein n=1 Tax=Tannerella forsythia (strain ATCC 43037 / JCM 10827 / CCUG 21028 A / KCTC 5666 / FDC 338) TaxID=203275 RepID=G8UP54_TANFA|nr:hypothetical protein BFO_1854 [Tannerella forsythia 92A2]BAR49203.1 hypothetical protein TF3313_1700 [Tannerella forsythia 3313]
MHFGHCLNQLVDLLRLHNLDEQRQQISYLYKKKYYQYKDF